MYEVDEIGSRNLRLENLGSLGNESQLIQAIFQPSHQYASRFP